MSFQESTAPSAVAQITQITHNTALADANHSLTLTRWTFKVFG